MCELIAFLKRQNHLIFTTTNGYVRVRVKMKAEKEENQKPNKGQAARKKKNSSAAKSVSSKNPPSELAEQRWSVVTFESRAAAGLTYDEAIQKLDKLREENKFGLCIITDEAAERVNSK